LPAVRRVSIRLPGPGTPRDALAVLGWGALLALLSYRAVDLLPEAGLDPSWRAGLHLGAQAGLDWGTDIAFSYGPLGHLAIPKLYYDSTGVLALAWTQLLRVVALGLVFALARRALGGPLAFVAVLLVAAPLDGSEVIIAAVVGLVVAVRTQRHPLVRPLLAAVAALAAVSVLVKINVGISVGAIAAVAAAAGPGTRRERLEDLGLLAGTFLVAVTALWVLAGQSLGALPDFARTAVDIVTGYAEAMQFDDPELARNYTLAFAVIAAGVVSVWPLGALVGPRARVAALALWLVTAWLQFKAGFVRHDLAHAILFFTPFAALALVLTARPEMRRATLLLAVVGFVAMVGATEQRLDRLWSPIQGVSDAWEQAFDLADGAERAAIREEARANIRAATAVPDGVIADVFPRTTHVFPTETSVVWAYGLRWRPLPIFQSYQAYTPHLDAVNRERLQDDAQAPERLLIHAQNGQIDERYVGFDQPEVTLEILCRFRPVIVTPAWMSAARGPSRCGAMRPLATVRARWDETVDVPDPPPGTIVVASVEGVAVAGFERLRTFAYKARQRTVTMNGASFRFLPRTAAGPLVLRSDDVDLPAGFSLVPQASTIEFGRAGSVGDGQDITIRFAVVPVAGDEEDPAAADRR
jgi:hypothetical protein